MSTSSPPAGPVPVEVTDALAPATRDAVVALAATAQDVDGSPPLSEAALLQVRGRSHGDAVRHLLARGADGTPVGYGHLTPAATGQDADVAELVVSPAHRRQGVGGALVTAALGARTAPRLELWAHGDSPGARALARREGLDVARELLTLRAPLSAPLPEPQVPQDVVVRTFVPGQDEAAWLAVNARAFAAHPEQGAWSAEDLLAREAEDWFDPAGFFLVEDAGGGGLLAFHWTKVVAPQAPGPGSAGEVYVVGVDPRAQGRRLGRLVTLLGLRHLQALGLPVAELYVEADNAPALAVYAGLGFERSGADVLYATP